VKLHLQCVALIVLPCCITAVNPVRSWAVAFSVLIAFFCHFSILEAFRSRSGGILSPQGFATLAAAGAALIVMGRMAAYVFGAASDGFGWLNLSSAGDLPVREFDHLFDLALVIAFPVAVAPAICSVSPGRRFRHLACAALIAVGIVFSFSRAAWTALAVETVLLLSLIPSRRSAIFVGGGLLAAVALVVLVPGVAERALTILSFSHQTNIQRLEQWAVAVDLVGRSPFLGHGLGAFGDLFWKAKGAEAAWYWCPHNLFIHIAVECGLPALFVFMAWISHFLRQMGETRRAALSTEINWLAVVRFGGIVSFWGLLCYGFFDL
jgi:O-antigen ligase